MYVLKACASLGTWYVLMNPNSLAIFSSELEFSGALRVDSTAQLRKKDLQHFYITIKAGMLQFKPVTFKP